MKREIKKRKDDNVVYFIMENEGVMIYLSVYSEMYLYVCIHAVHK